MAGPPGLPCTQPVKVLTSNFLAKGWQPIGVSSGTGLYEAGICWQAVPPSTGLLYQDLGPAKIQGMTPVKVPTLMQKVPASTAACVARSTSATPPPIEGASLLELSVLKDKLQRRIRASQEMAKDFNKALERRGAADLGNGRMSCPMHVPAPPCISMMQTPLESARRPSPQLALSELLSMPVDGGSGMAVHRSQPPDMFAAWMPSPATQNRTTTSLDDVTCVHASKAEEENSTTDTQKRSDKKRTKKTGRKKKTVTRHCPTSLC